MTLNQCLDIHALDTQSFAFMTFPFCGYKSWSRYGGIIMPPYLLPGLQNMPPYTTQGYFGHGGIVLYKQHIVHCSQVPWGPNFVQNGDPMGTRFWVRWAPNGDLHQHKWGPNEHISKIDRNKLISWNTEEKNYGTSSQNVASFGTQVCAIFIE